MIVVIQDANILIDLADVELLEAFFRLEIEAHTTDLVWHEVRDHIAVETVTNQLHVTKLTPEDIGRLLELLAKTSRRLSLADCSVLQLAMSRKAVLLTGDESLRKAATKFTASFGFSISSSRTRSCDRRRLFESSRS